VAEGNFTLIGKNTSLPVPMISVDRITLAHHFVTFSSFASWSHHNWPYSSHGVGTGPLLRCLDGSGLIVLPALSHIVGERIIRVRGSEEGLDGEEDSADLEGRGPVI